MVVPSLILLFPAFVVANVMYLIPKRWLSAWPRSIGLLVVLMAGEAEALEPLLKVTNPNDSYLQASRRNAERELDGYRGPPVGPWTPNGEAFAWTLLFSQAALLALATGVGLAYNVRLRWMPLITSAMTVVALSYTLFNTPTVWNVWKARTKYPVVSVRQRLASLRHDHLPDRLPTEFEDSLTANNTSQPYEIRQWRAPEPDWSHTLQVLHQRTLAEFIERDQQGQRRMPANGKDSTDRLVSRAEPVGLSSPPLSLRLPEPLPDSWDVPEATPAAASEPPMWVFKSLHRSSLLEFVTPFSLGYVRDKDYVVGFESHHFTKIPVGQDRWSIYRLELVGLLKHDKPVVYVSTALPRMDQADIYPLRDLDGFERAGLEKLSQGSDLEVRPLAPVRHSPPASPGRIDLREGDPVRERLRVLGSIRAMKNCLVCHDVPRGTLLGAFSYKLVR